ncbi:MAG: 3-dehydroquinate synthase [Bacteroidales bacterium]|nr:3-dehydroquinate synthase [Bacteroidales bacterium]
MKVIEIKTDTKSSKIYIGESIQNLKNYLPQCKVVIVTDEVVSGIYRSRFSEYPVIEIGVGEKIKTIDTLEFIFNRFIELEVDRSTYIVAVGGGIVCDVTGFAASVFMRGLRFGFVSTTLLSQVDASVGGKNGVNYHRYKNMIGVFNQPDFVICDTEMLKTLDRKEFIAGFAEIVKGGAIRDENLFRYLENNWQKALEMDTEVINHLVYESVMVKSRVVEADEKEKGERRLLNFGHTFAHSFEKLVDILHGEAVSIGMMVASGISEKLGYLKSQERDRIRQLLKNIGLPVSIGLDVTKLLAAARQDKKREGETIHLILLSRIGEAFSHKIKLNKLEELVYDMRSDFR